MRLGYSAAQVTCTQKPLRMLYRKRGEKKPRLGALTRVSNKHLESRRDCVGTGRCAEPKRRSPGSLLLADKGRGLRSLVANTVTMAAPLAVGLTFLPTTVTLAFSSPSASASLECL